VYLHSPTIANEVLASLCVTIDIFPAAMEAPAPSVRAHDHVRRVAGTAGNPESGEAIAARHIAEAVGCRSPDRGVWA